MPVIGPTHDPSPVTVIHADSIARRARARAQIPSSITCARPEERSTFVYRLSSMGLEAFTEEVSPTPHWNRTSARPRLAVLLPAVSAQQLDVASRLTASLDAQLGRARHRSKELHPVLRLASSRRGSRA